MIYVAKYATTGEFEAEQDDPSSRGVSLEEGLDMMASPQLSRLSSRMSAEWVQKCKDEVEEDLRDALDDQSGPPMPLEWKTAGWQEVSPVNGRRSHQVWDVYSEELGLVAKMVIQRVPCDE